MFRRAARRGFARRVDGRGRLAERREQVKPRRVIRRKGTGWWRVAVALVGSFCLLIVVFAGADYSMNAGKIHGGVSVGGVDLGGKTPAQAREILSRQKQRELGVIHLRGPEGVRALSAQSLGMNLDVGSSVERAYSVGRSGGVFGDLMDRVRADFGAVKVEPAIDYRPEVAKEQVRRMASRLDRSPRNASIRISGGHVRVIDAREGYRVDRTRTLESIRGAVESMSGKAKIYGETIEPQVPTSSAVAAARKARGALEHDVTLSALGRQWTLSRGEIGRALYVTRSGRDLEVHLSPGRLRESLSGVYDALTVRPVEAGYVVDGPRDIKVTPSKNGRKIESEKLIGAIRRGVFSGDFRYEVPLAVWRPKLTTDEARRLKPTQLIGEYRTNYMTYSDDPGRVKNLQIASRAISGRLVAPGEIFSFNAVAAPLHYYPTKVIVGGKVEKADGGGLCQVSTNLYMAANEAGLEPIERHPHYAELPYVRPGFDATVWFGSLDMKFKNTSPGYILLEESVDTKTGWVTARIYGRPTGKHVEMWSKKVYSSPKMTKWVTYKKVTKDGKVLFDGVLHTDTYKPLKND